MKFVFFVLIVFSTASVLTAQGHVKFIFVSKNSLDPIAQVSVSQFVGDSLVDKRFSDRNGIVYFDVVTNAITSFDYDHVSYSPINEPPSQKYNLEKFDTIVYRLRMENTRILDEVVVKPIGTPDTVFWSKKLSVGDFDFTPKGDLLLLTYPKSLKKGSELLIYDGKTVTGELNLEEPALELLRDYRGNVHARCENSFFSFVQKNNQLQVGKIEKDYFLKYIAPIVDSNQSKFFFSSFNPDYPSFEYFTYDSNDEIYTQILQITDTFMMELYRSEYKWVDIRTKLWAKNKENQTGIDKEIWVGAQYFTSSIYYKELYAPMFQKNDTFYVFDHYKNWLFRLNKNGELIDSLGIYHHLEAGKTGWKRNIIQDQITGEIYLYFDKSGYVFLRHFNVNTGQIGPAIKLSHRFVDKVQVRENFVYYTYRPFETIQKKFLYRERMIYEFKPAKVLSGDIITDQIEK